MSEEPTYYQVLYRHPVHTGPDRKTVKGYMNLFKIVSENSLADLFEELVSRDADILGIKIWQKGKHSDMQDSKPKKKTIEAPIEFEIGDIAWIVKDNTVECMEISRIDVKVTKNKREVFYGDYMDKYDYFKHGRFEVSDLFHTKEQAFAELKSRFEGMIVQAEERAKEQEKELNEDRN